MKKIKNFFRKNKNNDVQSQKKVIKYTLKQGETIHDVAQLFQQTTDQILEYNNLDLNTNHFKKKTINIQIDQNFKYEEQQNQDVYMLDDQPYDHTQNQKNQHENNQNQQIQNTENQEINQIELQFIQKLEKTEKFNLIYQTQLCDVPGILTICPGQLWFDPDYDDFKQIQRQYKEQNKSKNQLYLTDFQMSINLNDLQEFDVRKEPPYEYIDIILNGVKNQTKKKGVTYKIVLKHLINSENILEDDKSIIHYIMQKLYHQICKFKITEPDYEPQSIVKYMKTEVQIDQNVIKKYEQELEQKNNQKNQQQVQERKQLILQKLENNKQKKNFNNNSNSNQSSNITINQNQSSKQSKQEKIYPSMIQESFNFKKKDSFNQQQEEQKQIEQQEQEQQKYTYKTSNFNTNNNNNYRQQAQNNNQKMKINEKLYPTLLQTSDIFSQRHFQDLVDSLPGYLQQNNWSLKFSPNKNGYSYEEFIRRTKDLGPHILVCEDMKQNIFGAFITEGWSQQQGFFGTGEAYLFSFRKTKKENMTLEQIKQKKNYIFEKYLWSGLDQNIQHCDDLGFSIGIGVRYGLFIHCDFTEGFSGASTTFNTTQSLTSEEIFELYNFEIYSVE